MNKLYINPLFMVPLLFLSFLPSGSGQTNPMCNPGGASELDYPSSAFFNYGSGANIRNPSRRMDITIGQTVVGTATSNEEYCDFGYWGKFQAPPFAPIVKATQGELLDRIQISWAVEPLGALPSQGFKLFRDGVFLGKFDNTTFNYNDFNVIAGKPYNYEVKGLNIYGEGPSGKALGFQVPNGVVTGWVHTIAGSAVADAMVTLMPMQGSSLRLDHSNNVWDGALWENDSVGLNPLLPQLGKDWTITFWMKTVSAQDSAVLMQLAPSPLYFRPLNTSTGHEGLEIAVSATDPAFLRATFPDSSKNAWHHVALSYDGSADRGRLYLDGVIKDMGHMDALQVAEALYFGARTGKEGWDGYLDELRVYHRKLDEIELAEVMEGTASKLTPGLKYYWKFDEELGMKSYDILRRKQLHFCGAEFVMDRPPVRTAGKTNSAGYYRIESASYGTGTTFLAEPMKHFYAHRSLNLVRNQMDYDSLPNFSLTRKATLELWVNSAGPDGIQCLLSKRWNNFDFRIMLDSNNVVKCYLNGLEQAWDTLGVGFQHLAFTIDSSSTTTITAYQNGIPLGSPYVFPQGVGNWSDFSQAWLLGARPSGMGPMDNNVGTLDNFGGLIDEFAVYDTIWPADTLKAHSKRSRDMHEKGLRVYFALDEGSGTRLYNSGSVFLPPGKNKGADWSPLAANQSTTLHEFSPATRQVTLNPSVTSVDQVDFTDRSSIPITGYVRYANTECFAKGVEILVNGSSNNPIILTDSTGKFVVDLDPGATAELTPKLADHIFSPQNWTVTNVTSPTAGILFTDLTKRKITGQLAGGHCKMPIITLAPPQFASNARVTVSTKDKCYEKVMLIDTINGMYEFDNLPPLEVTIAVTRHDNPLIYSDFQAQGGHTIDLTKKDSLGVDFIYIAPPQVQVKGFEGFIEELCTDKPIVIAKGDIVRLTITAYEQYGPGQELDDRCYLDSNVIITINNTFDFKYDFITPQDSILRYDTSLMYGVCKYNFMADHPNQFDPYLQTIEITADDLGRKSEPYFRQAIITGTIVGESKFTTQLPVLPSYILRDPPGDGSYAYLEAGTKVCNSLHFENAAGGGPYFAVNNETGIHNELVIPFIGNVLENEFIWHQDAEVQTSFLFNRKNSLEYCVTNKTRVSTDDGDLVVGGATILDNTHLPLDTLAGNDVYVGVGFNVIFSDSKEITFNKDSCRVYVDNVVTAEPDTFVTNYKYSEWNIEHNVIRYLDTLIANGIDQGGINTKSRTSWLAYIGLNKVLKELAVKEQNISFDAGIQYEASVTMDTTGSTSSGPSEEVIASYLFTIATGQITPVTLTNSNTIGVTVETRHSQISGDGYSNSLTTGYVLKDNDPGDTWTMNIKKDHLYHTPVFEIEAGQTSCPWEVGTAHRQGVAMIELDGVTRTNVPSNEAAVFHFQLQNTSSTYETFTYVMNTGPESNPDGLIIKLNGAILDHTVLYAIPYDEGPLEITITAERGPSAYSYHGTEVVFYAECHDTRSAALGYPPDFESYLYSAKYLNVDFIKPCSEVEVTTPLPGWVVKPDTLNPGSENFLTVTASGYDLDNDDFQELRFQYRPENGDGAWININSDTIRKSELGPVFYNYAWNTGGSPPLPDGPYEIRAVTVCAGGAEKNGYSHIVKGRIERQPPSLIGTPEPSDGVYNVGDEISFSFNKVINCNKLHPAINVMLFDATTDEPIDIDVTCYENKIILDPNFDNRFFENRILRAELHDIEDLTGNQLVYEKWEFYVDRNELAWLTDSVGVTKFEDQTRTLTAGIHNRGGYPVPFKILDVPEWVHVVPNQGTLAPNEIRAISFTIDSTLAFGLWSDSITLHTETGQNPFFMGGDERLPVGVRVVCRPPVWELNPIDFENSENMVLELNIDGTPSKDVEDMVLAFMGDSLRGRANVQYVPQLNKYLAYLTIYGYQDQVLSPIRLEIWDASACLRYAVMEDDFVYQPDIVIGNPINPQVLHTDNNVLRDLVLGNGWNWVSFNLDFPDPSLDAALESLLHPDNDLMTGQSAFAVYLNSAGWLGSLNALSNNSMYIYRSDQADTLKMMGAVIDPATHPIPVVAGWNWIGYIPNYSLSVNAALSSLTPQTGDLIKSQASFAQYINNNIGWIGNLKFMQPPLGYQLKLSAPGSLLYPPPSSNLTGGGPDQLAHTRGLKEQNPPVASFWTVDPTQYEHSMTLIGMMKANEVNATSPTMELGVFAGNEVRGGAQAIYIQPLDAYLFFLTTYANSGGEQLRFKLFDSSNGSIQDLTEQMYFTPDLHQGSINVPVPFTLPSTGTHESAALQGFEVQPNPFHTETMIRFSLAKAQEVKLTVTTISGKAVSSVRTTANEGLNTLVWKGQSDTGAPLPAGVYFVRLQTESGSVVRKVVLQ